MSVVIQHKYAGKDAGKDAGFTLIEVLAALLIFSLAIIGLSQAVAQSTRAVIALDSKMLAGIVADNQLVLARDREIEIGVVNGQTSQLSRGFNYTTETRPTEIARLFQITVKVTGLTGAQVLEQRIGFKSIPVPISEAEANPDLPDIPDQDVSEDDFKSGTRSARGRG